MIFLYVLHFVAESKLVPRITEETHIRSYSKSTHTHTFGQYFLFSQFSSSFHYSDSYSFVNVFLQGNDSEKEHSTALEAEAAE